MCNQFSLEGKIAIVTGAARGNGKAIAEGFLKAGATVYFIDVLSSELQETIGILQSDKAKPIIADLSTLAGIQSIVQSVHAIDGRIDILVNNAGISIGGESSENYSEDNWNKTMQINLKAPFLLSQQVAKYMIEKKEGGSIINITSLGAELGFSNNPSYIASKGGLKQLTKAFAKDWAKYNIRANNVGPGYVKTNMTKKSYSDPELKKQRDDRMMLSRWAEPEDLIGLVVFLASDASRYITGQDIYVDGGWLANGI